MTTDETRRYRLCELLDELGSLAALARLIGHNGTTQISQWKTAAPNSRTGKPRTIGNDSARRIEAATGKPRGWMDTPPSPAGDAAPALPAQVVLSANEPAPLAPDEAALLGLYRGLTAEQRGELVRSAEATKQMNDRILDELGHKRA